MSTSQETSGDDLSATAADYRRALLAVRDLRQTSNTAWSLWVALLTTHYAMPGHTVTAEQLAARHRLATPGAATLNYGKLARAVADQLGYSPPERRRGKRDPMWWMTLAVGGEGDERDEQFQFTMRAQLAEALEQMRWVQPHPAPATA